MTKHYHNKKYTDDNESLDHSSYKDDDSRLDSEQGDEVAKLEAKHVQNVKLGVFVVLAISMIGDITVYFTSRNTEERQFKEQFYDDAQKVLGSIGSSLERSLGAIDSLALTAITTAIMSNQTFPFVTMPNFGIHVAKTQQLTAGVCTYLNPVVHFNQRLEWEKYSASNNTHLRSFVNEALHIQDTWEYFYGPMPQNYTWQGHDVIHGDDYENGGFYDIPYNNSQPGRLDIHLPFWHRFPLVITSYHPQNWDWYSTPHASSLTKMMTHRKAVLSEPFMLPRSDSPEATAILEPWCEYFKDYISPGEECMEPMSTWFYPIIDNVEQIKISEIELLESSNDVKGMISVEFYWRSWFKDILPDGSKGIVLVTENSCTAEKFTYQIDGPIATYLGVGDLHDTKYNGISVSSSLFDLNSFRVEESHATSLPMDETGCIFTFHVYPSDQMKALYNTNNDIILAISSVVFIIFPCLVFLAYNRKVERQRKDIMDTAKRSDAIISSLFPSNVRDKLYPIDNIVGNNKSDLNDGPSKNQSSPPIAQLYPETTVLFADIVGFTAWSSVRDPYQVFTLLEGIYGAFDKIAMQKSVFKVETIGDCYVAVVGLPEPRKDHAATMVKFARSILLEMTKVTTELETLLGPGTADLTLRIGINSGPTTAGVLRGSKGRFQLFGDTVNTAARMESSSTPGRILCSQKTADILIASQKQHWITPRSDLVNAKGKGSLQCYWINVKTIERKHVKTSSRKIDNLILEEDEIFRLVNWMVELFESMLTNLISSRVGVLNNSTDKCDTDDIIPVFGAPRGELSETLEIPTVQEQLDIENKVQLSSEIKQTLHEFISTIAQMYRGNMFHNFDHACHVVMAAKKLLSQCIKPNEISNSSMAFGITTDPLIQFAIVFSALIHDVDHPGVSNAQLVKESTEVATIYNNKSVAEQNSIVLSWNLLMEPKYAELRNLIMPNEIECKRFRQLLVNAVMATDLFDPELKLLRENRWNIAFDTDITDSDEKANMRAAIIIELIIQASDVSHTMQHWHVYQRWNSRLFFEMKSSYINGRAEKDPKIDWYDGELWFFDNYIIPLAKKLKTCGVFGVSCDEFLNYAMDNRDEWAGKGRSIVDSYDTISDEK